MDSLKILKQLKKIEPEKAYTERSLRSILSTERPRRLSFWRVMAESLEAGSAIVLVGAFLVLILGGFSGIRSLNFTNLNPSSLKAEAEAIDIQIQLANLHYQDFARTSRKESTAPNALSAPMRSAALSTLSTSDQATSSEASTTEVSVDAALRALSE